MTAIAALSRCIPTWSSASTTITSRDPEEHKERNGFSLDTDLSADDWAALVERYKRA